MIELRASSRTSIVEPDAQYVRGGRWEMSPVFGSDKDPGCSNDQERQDGLSLLQRKKAIVIVNTPVADRV